MGRLVLTRRTHEQLRLTRDASADDLLDQLEDEGIWVTVVEVEDEDEDEDEAGRAIEAPEGLLVLRDELIGICEPCN
ncbi:carbon storage regulator [Stutzerimonas nitrititolerans]|uniref:carbon storage regulator n=1 Tax=Stutzerimonas nitrititolerans TaxID=2482751 RepID=UPI0028ABC108|nr:carbon storage regulator [Stutzerimonas nitrititolerans]